MKTMFFAAVLLGLLVGQYEFTEGADWVQYSATDSDLFLYDKESVVSPSKNARRVHTKTVPVNEEEKQKKIAGRVKLLPEVDYRGYSYTTMIEEIDCQTRERCKLSRTDYASGQPGGTETVLNRWEWGRACYDDMWMPLVPGTPEAALYKIVCAAQGDGQ